MSKIQVVSPPADVCEHPQRAAPASDSALFDRLPDDLALDLAEMFGVLADSTRLKIIATLMGGEVCVCDIADRLSLRQSTVSHQLRLLRALRLVSHRKAGRTIYYTLLDEHVASLLRQSLDHLTEGSARAPAAVVEGSP